MLANIFEFLIVSLYIYQITRYRISRNLRNSVELVSAAIFGLTLEYLNIFINENYQYSQQFILQIGSYPSNIPISIGLAWGLIITACIKVTDNFFVWNWCRPVFDAMLALSIDLSMDVIAIRIEGGFWNWQVDLLDYPTEHGFFGVPWGNFTSWFYVVIIYSSIIRYSRKKLNVINYKYYLYFVIMPIFAYIPLFLMIAGSISIYFLLNLKSILNPAAYALFPILILGGIAIFSFIVCQIENKDQMERRINRETVPLFLVFHLYFLIIFLYLDLFSTIPIILYLSLFLFAIDLVIHLFSCKTGL